MITIDELEKYLWDSAVILRGLIDAAAYKEYIFPLVFFKRISDVYDEEYQKHFDEAKSYGNSDDEAAAYAQDLMKESAIQIPDGAHWRDVFDQTEDIGQKLKETFMQIEHANQAKEIDGRLVGGLEGIFGDKNIWTNKAKMPDATIRALLNHYNSRVLNLAECPADEMGTGYEYLIGQFADDAGHTAQEFYTNRTVVELMAEILQLKSGESIYDPTCGSGGMLIKSLTYLKDKGEEWRDVKVYGQELNADTSAIARMNCYLHGVHEFNIVNDDTLERPAFIKNGKVQQFDVVLANPPYSISAWNREKFEHDKYGRCFLGCPPQSRADYAFIQHILASMDDKNGRCAILLPHGVLNRGEEKEIRINHIKTDNIDAIVGLGRNLFFNSGLESFIFFCSNRKPKERKNKILFIEAENCTHKEGKQSYLYPEDISKIVHAYNNLEDEEGFSKWVDVKDIQDGNLNIKSYVKGIDNGEYLSVSDSFLEYCSQQNDLCASLNGFELIEEKNQNYLSNIKPSYSNKIGWQRVKLGTVASEYSVRIANPSESQYDFYIGSDCIGRFDFTINKRSDAKTITSAQKEFKTGDYLLVRRSLYGSDFRERAPRADFDGCCSADILTIRENPKFIYNGYLLFVLYSKELWDFIVANSSGGLTRRIKWKQLAEFEFSLPPLEEQKRLSEKLWAAYEVKQSYLNMIAATDEMVKSQFIEMFGDPIVNDKQWPDYSCLSEVTQIVLGSTPNSKEPSYWDGDIRWITPAEMKDQSYYIYDTVRHITEEGRDAANLTMLPEGTVLFSTRAPIGKVAIAGKEMCCNQGFKNFICSEKLNNVFLYYTLKYKKDHLCSLGTGTTFKELSKKTVESLKVAVPPIDLQERFEDIYNQADKSKSELRKSIESIDKVIKSLINENL